MRELHGESGYYWTVDDCKNTITLDAFKKCKLIMAYEEAKSVMDRTFGVGRWTNCTYEYTTKKRLFEVTITYADAEDPYYNDTEILGALFCTEAHAKAYARVKQEEYRRLAEEDESYWQYDDAIVSAHTMALLEDEGEEN